MVAMKWLYWDEDSIESFEKIKRKPKLRKEPKKQNGKKEEESDRRDI